MVNKEDINDRFKLIAHRLIARRLRQEPYRLENARAYCEDILDKSPDNDFYQEWHNLLRNDADYVSRRIVQRDEFMYWLRASSPLGLFSGVNLTDENLRRRMYRKAKFGLDRLRENYDIKPTSSPK